METIGLIAAMASEGNALLRLVRQRDRIKAAPFRGTAFEIAGKRCILLISGMGIERAGRAAEYLMNLIHPGYLVSFGIAGAVGEDLNIGDVVVAKQYCTFQNDSIDKLQLLAAFPASAYLTITDDLAIRKARLFDGTAVTTRGSQPPLEMLRNISQPILEMETSGIARVSEKAGVPLYVIRSISDGPLSPIPFDLGAVMDENYNFQARKMAMILLKQPRLLLRSGEMAKNSRLAAANAALAVSRFVSLI